MWFFIWIYGALVAWILQIDLKIKMFSLNLLLIYIGRLLYPSIKNYGRDYLKCSFAPVNRIECFSFFRSELILSILVWHPTQTLSSVLYAVWKPIFSFILWAWIRKSTLHNPSRITLTVGVRSTQFVMAGNLIFHFLERNLFSCSFSFIFVFKYLHSGN